MGAIAQRDAADLATAHYDIVVVGGGIHGAMVHLEASRLALRSVLVERADFGGETSYNTLRTIHGGLRYLQSLDLPRCWESTGERQWYLNRMRPLVETLPCLLPLYGRGMKRKSAMRAGLAVNDLISAARLDRGGTDVPRGAILSPESTLRRFPGVRESGLQGAGHWSDLRMRSPPRIVIETLLWAKQMGGAAFNYVEATELLAASGRVCGVAAVDRRTGASLELRAPIVVNAAGPGVRALAGRWDRDVPELFHASAAWNVLFDRPALSDHAVAVRDERSARPTMLFATSLNGRLLIGTGHAAMPDGDAERRELIVEANLDSFIDAINAALPELRLDRDDVIHVYSGSLPARSRGAAEPRERNVIHDHGGAGGPRGLYSLSGIKFTTARVVARRLLERISRAGGFPGRLGRVREYPPVTDGATAAIFPLDAVPAPDDPALRRSFERIIEEEAVEHLDDLILRRSNLGDDPRRATAFAASLSSLQERWRANRVAEIGRVAARIDSRRWADRRDVSDVPRQRVLSASRLTSSMTPQATASPDPPLG